MLKHISELKKILFHEFNLLYQHYHHDDIYGCALVLNPYMMIESLSISTTRSLFAEHEDDAQYLSPHDQWNVSKWRFHTGKKPFYHFNLHFSAHIQHRHFLGTAATQKNKDALNNSDLLINIYNQVKNELILQHSLDASKIVFFLHLSDQPYIEQKSIHVLNSTGPLVQSFLNQHNYLRARTHSARLNKLSQTDKDLLVDLAQWIRLEPFDYMQIAHQAYLFTLDTVFIDLNPYIQRLIHTISEMDTNPLFAMTRDEILERIDQFYPAVTRLHSN